MRSNLDAVVNASERAAALTRQLLAYAGKGRFVIERLNLSGLVREITNLLQASIPKNVAFRLDFSLSCPRLKATPRRSNSSS